MGARHRRCRQHPVAWVKGAGGSDSSTPGTGTVSSLMLLPRLLLDALITLLAAHTDFFVAMAYEW